MIKKICKCDICGQEMDIYDRIHTKVKMKKETSFFGERGWIKYDLCEDCQKKFVEWINETKRNIENLW